MRVLFLAATAALALTACSGSNNEANNAATDMNAGMTDVNAGMTDMNATNVSINGADGMNATENAAANDLATNDADTNLANGM